MVVTSDIRKVTFSSALYFFSLSCSRNSKNYWVRNRMLNVSLLMPIASSNFIGNRKMLLPVLCRFMPFEWCLTVVVFCVEVWFCMDQRLPGHRDAVSTLPLPQPRCRLCSLVYVERLPLGTRCHAVSIQTCVRVKLRNHVTRWWLRCKFLLNHVIWWCIPTTG